MRYYDSLAEVYDNWVLGDPASGACHAFYRRLCLATSGILVEIGVGTGRIALGLAESGRPLIGIDVSERMLAVCRREVDRRGLSGKLTLCRMDAQNLAVRNIDLITLPFRTLGHFTTPQSRLRVFEEVSRALVPGGQFVLDHYVPDRAWAESHDAIPRLMHKAISEMGECLLVWDTYRYDFAAGLMDCLITVERTDSTGSVSRQHTAFPFAWVYPQEVISLAAATGFVVEAVHGTFDGGKFSESSDDHIWILRRNSWR